MTNLLNLLNSMIGEPVDEGAMIPQDLIDTANNLCTKTITKPVSSRTKIIEKFACGHCTMYKYNDVTNVVVDIPEYKYSYDDIIKEFPFILMHERMPQILSGAMGNEFYIVKFEHYDDMIRFKNMVSEKK